MRYLVKVAMALSAVLAASPVVAYSSEAHSFEEQAAFLASDCGDLVKEANGMFWGTREVRITRDGMVSYLRTSISIEKPVSFDLRDVYIAEEDGATTLAVRTYVMGEAEWGPRIITLGKRQRDKAWIDCRTPDKAIAAFRRLKQMVQTDPVER